MHLRGNSVYFLQGITEVTNVNAIEFRFGESNLTHLHPTEINTRWQKPGETLKVLVANIK